ncbi:MAG: hypothetical protein JRI70_05800 [Deltaproteobacteria bacterium]|nr:hypothetical protein [Deltaproteobacteria bacterium]MBW2171541.1 hypothetical protein [Deltaproteobacteria bacterium]
MQNLSRCLIVVCVGILLNACASTKLTEVWVDEASKNKPVSDVLIIGVTEEEGVRRSFETKFVKAFQAEGAEAVSSANVIKIDGNRKLEKDEILKAVYKYDNDSVLITTLVSVDSKQEYRPPRMYGGGYGGYGGFYDHYGYGYGYTHYDPGYSVTNTSFRLDTNLYDVKTEKVLWYGVSQTMNPKSDTKLIDDVIKVVMNALKKNGLVTKK